ncbi:kirola-like [Cynara cardunculus var. scolymus]|uniref:kirola-like n=1 Tax=Cynara cardunculus var. scolymus TaxID=59895 RepID=UPI000D6255FC|nr:kirola-like [Cynara cardunculus var. scolymus]
MGRIGKLIMYQDISSCGDMFHDLLRYRPHDIASISPDKVHGCDIVDGQPGVVGSVFCWNYTIDGKKQTTKTKIEEIDETNHKMVFNTIEGDLLGDLYKSFKIMFHVEPHGDGRQLATWTFEFEKLNTSVPYPTNFMDYLLAVTRDMDAHNTNQ